MARRCLYMCTGLRACHAMASNPHALSYLPTLLTAGAGSRAKSTTGSELCCFSAARAQYGHSMLRSPMPRRSLSRPGWNAFLACCVLSV